VKHAEELLERLKVVEEELGKGEVLSDQKKYKELSTEHAHLSDVREAYTSLKEDRKALDENKKMLSQEKDAEMRAVIEEEITLLQTRIPEKEQALEILLVPPDPDDDKNTIMEIRAGTGGDEAALFVGDCVRMYQNYAANKGWHCEMLSMSESEVGGFKEYIMSVTGKQVYRHLRYEGGTHRVQRVPATETQGRVHTSAITVATLIEPDDDDDIQIDEKDLKIDTFRASGAGGQHVNTTDSAVRITHIPTGAVSQCQDERSQHKNKAKAMRMLKAKIADEMRRQREKERSDQRSEQVGSGDRSERIRTYNYPQNRITDHRIDLTLYKLDRIIEGEMDELVEPLIAHNRSI